MDVIDVWDIATFDGQLVDLLQAQTALIRSYWTVNRRQFLEREASDHTGVMPENPYAAHFYSFLESLIPTMHLRTIRTWHYTRLAPHEIEEITTQGIRPSTLDTISVRLRRMVEHGYLSREFADELFRASPFHSDQLGPRSNKFWMTSQPLPIDDGGVEPLLNMWGGESVSFTHYRKSVGKILGGIGAACVVELATPLGFTPDSYSAAKAVAGAFARTLKVRADGFAFDLYTTKSLGPNHVLAIHHEGCQTFERLARGYPPGFVDRYGEDIPEP